MSWVGGDIPGLQAMGAKMKSAPEKVNGVVSELSATVAKLGSDASWSGTAGEEMRGRWSGDAANVGSVGTFIGLVGAAVGDLGDKLHEVESALYNAADSCKGRGAQIDMGSGKPLPLTVTGNPNAPAVQSALDAQKEYQAAYDYAMNAARTYRLETLGKLKAVVEPIFEEKSDTTLTPDQAITMGAVLRGLYTAKLEAKNMRLEDLDKKLDSQHKKLEAPLKNAEAEIQKLVSGKGYDIDQVVAAMRGKDGALADFQRIEGNLNAEIGELRNQKDFPFAKILNTKLHDLPAVSKTLSKLAPELKFLGDVPVLDVAAAAGIAYFQGKDDIEKGGDPVTSYAKEGTAAGAGVLGGILAGGAVVSAASWAAGPEAGAPVTATYVAVGVGIVAAAGVGEFAHQAFHEHWSEDIHDRGVLGGILHGVENTGARTGESLGQTLSSTKDTVEDTGKKAWHATEDTGKKAWHATEDAGKKVWHSIFG
jgi:flagellar hook-basal body complex protein FliE